MKYNCQIFFIFNKSRAEFFLDKTFSYPRACTCRVIETSYNEYAVMQLTLCIASSQTHLVLTTKGTWSLIKTIKH